MLSRRNETVLRTSWKITYQKTATNGKVLTHYENAT